MGTTIFERNVPSASTVEHSLATTRTGVFWTEDLPAELRPARPALTGDTRADLVIVGAGYCGLWTALLAATRDPGRRIVVVESQRVGWAASGRNGGFCEASLTHGHDNGMNRWPDEMPALERMGLENLDEIQRTEQEHGLDFQFERTGSMTVAVEPHQVPWLREAASAGEGTFLDTGAVRAAVNSPTYLAGLSSPDSTALVHPARMAAELARAVENLGVEIVEHSPVTALESDAHGVTVVTAEGRIRTDQVALATNVFPSLLKRNRLMTVPVYDFALMTEPLSPAQWGEIGWGGRQGLSDPANQFHYYRPTQDGRILFGGYDAIHHVGGKVNPAHEHRPETWRRLASHFFTTFPQLEGLQFSHRWAGAIDSCTRFTTFFGTARKGRVAYAAGFTGLGVGSTRFAGNVMLDLLEGKETERTRLEMVRKRPVPFPPEPAAALGVAMTKWAMDRADHNEGKRNMLLKTLDALGLGFDS